jgi:hypothetical protein
MKKEVEYLRQANEAQKWADQARTDKAKAAWLRIAQGWLGLVRGLSVEREAFERSVEQRATHQEESRASS